MPTLGWWRHERTDEDGNAVLRGFRPGALALEAGVLVDPTAAGGDARGTTSTRATVVLRSGPGETLHACGEVLAADRRATEEPYVCTLLPVPVVRLSVEGLGDDHDGFVRLTVVDAEKGPEVALQRARSPRIRGGMVDHEIRLRSGFRWGEDGPAEPVELLCRKGRYIAVAATARTLDSPLREPDAYRYSLPLLLDATDGDTSGTLVFRPCGRIVGTVVDEVGAPVPNAHIELRPEHRGLLRSTDSDAEGRFRFAGLDAGTYRLAARSDTHVLPPAVDVEVDPADGETPWTIEGSQGGHLRLSGGELRPGVPHELNVIGASGETLTLPRCRRPGNARWLYGPIPAGAWEVFVPRDPDGQRTFGLAPATVVAGQVTVVDVDAVEAPRYRIQGTLDRELPRGTVALLHRGALVSSCALGADDSFTLHSPCAGTHELRIGTSATDYVRIGTLEVEEGETVLPPIEVGRGSIRGSIPPRWKGAIGPVEFHLLGPHGADDDTPLARTRCRRGSFWRLELPDGRYRVLARDAARRIVLETEVEVLDGRVTGTLLHE